MYRHLLVPLDESRLSAANVTAAVELACSLNARVTFFHAMADFSATGEGALLRSIEPQRFAEVARGETDSVLSKAMVCARNAKVECQGMVRTSDRPAEAIVQAARDEGCDLIVMASRGARGVSAWLHASQTERVLRHTPVALLVTRVEANEPLRASERALAVIQDEHRSLAVVLQAMNQIVSETATGPTAAELPALEAMVGYLREFPQRLHHPKEELYLHPRLRERAPTCEQTLAEIESQHTRESILVANVEEALRAMRAGDADAAARVRDSVQGLGNAVREHIGFEERVILPMAAQHLSDEDWQGIANAFASNDDPRFGDMPAEEFRRIFARIAGMAAAGAGVVEARCSDD
jgi:hemerythrin-like domain-containing protein/nucleotide-binding universal stress UspA family protein